MDLSLFERVVPVYETPQPNAPLPLWTGSVTLDPNGIASAPVTGSGSISLHWLPEPGLYLSYDGPAANGFGFGQGIDNWSFEFDGKVAHGFPLRFNVGTHWRLEARLLQVPSSIDPDRVLARVVAHVPNMSRVHGFASGIVLTGNTCFEDDKWRILLKQVSDPSLDDALHRSSGYALTYACEITRIDEETFSVEEVIPVLDVFGEFLSFSIGRRISLMLATGYSGSGDVVWSDWEPHSVDPFRDTRTWLPRSDVRSDGYIFAAKEWPRLWPGFLRCLTHEAEGLPFRIALHWYLSANRPQAAVENTLVDACTAFELLGWLLLVQRGVVPVETYESKQWPWTRKLRKVLTNSHIQTDLPSEYQHISGLESYCKVTEQNPFDGPCAVISARNAIIHANPDWHSLDWRPKFDASSLALRYLGHILLHSFGYAGHTVSFPHLEEPKLVPWASVSD